MITITDFNPQRATDIESAYERFTQVANEQYQWPGATIPFEQFLPVLQTGLFVGYCIYDDDECVGYFLMEHNESNVYEARLMYLDAHISQKIAVNLLFEKIKADFKTHDFDSISIALLGSAVQEWVNYTGWHGFKPIGQVVMSLDFANPLSLEIFRKVSAETSVIPPDSTIKLKPWDNAFRTPELQQLIYTCFNKAVDALWDPRLSDIAYIPQVIDFITSNNFGAYGTFVDKATLLLFDANKPIGFCFVNMLFPGEVNIPLIGVHPDYQNRKLARLLLQQSCMETVKLIQTGEILATKITATTATHNHAAIKMYRHLGFTEQYWYPHIYITRAMLTTLPATPC